MAKKAMDNQVNPPLLDNLLGYKLRRVSSLAMATLAERLSDIGLKVSEIAVMFEILQEPNATSSHIGKVLDIKRANMTPLINGLMSRGLVDAKRKDGRSQGLFLTKEGEKLLVEVRTIVNEHEEMMATNLTDAERTKLLQLVDKVLIPMEHLKKQSRKA